MLNPQHHYHHHRFNCSPPLTAFHRRPTTSQPISPRTRDDLSSPNIHNNTRKTTTIIKQQQQRVKSFLMRNDHSHNNNIILHSSNSASSFPKMRPLSSSIKTYSKYQLNRRKYFATVDITEAYAYTPLFTDKARLNFINALEFCIKDHTLDLTAFNIGIHFIKALRHVFTLNTVLRNAIAVINLSKNPIGDTALPHVMRIISLSTAITHVDLSNTNISHKNADIIFTALERHNSLISLDVSSKDSTYRNRLLTSAMTFAMRALPRSCAVYQATLMDML